jgi:hypothetical protein
MTSYLETQKLKHNRRIPGNMLRSFCGGHQFLFKFAGIAEGVGEAVSGEKFFGSGVAFQIGVPKRGGTAEDELLEESVAFAAGLTRDVAGEDHVVAIFEVEEEFFRVFDVVEGNTAIFGFGLADGTVVERAGHVEDWDFNFSEGSVEVAFVQGNGRAHGDGGFDAGVGVGMFLAVQAEENFTGDRQRRKTAEGMAGDADAVEVEAMFEGRVVGIHFGELINGERNVERAVEGILEIQNGLAERLHPFGGPDVLPDGGITADMLEVDTDVAMAGPARAEIAVALTRAAETVGKNDDGQRAFGVRGIINFYGDVAVALGIVPVETGNADTKRAGRVLIERIGVAGANGWRRGQKNGVKK